MQQDPQKHLELIIDGLAERGFAIVDHFLSGLEVGQILETDEFQNSKLQFKRAGIGKQQDKKISEGIRGDYIHWIEPDGAPACIIRYFDRLHEIIQHANRSLYLSLKDCEIHMTIYPAGTFYKRHLDQFKSDDHRKLSVICYLNVGWREAQGGQLRMYLPQGPLDVFPLAGRLVCFRSDQIEHEVLPATHDRLSLTGWLVDKLS
jgi:SM-20-related protein